MSAASLVVGPFIHRGRGAWWGCSACAPTDQSHRFAQQRELEVGA